jgi:hypothetical protein
MITSGCLLPEPPTYREPEQTSPFLWGAIPSTTQIQFVKSGEPFKINVNLRSEDADEDLTALLLLNYLSARQSLVDWSNIEAGTLAEDRTIEMSPSVPNAGPCEPLSLVVSHVSNFRKSLPIDDSDVAVLTWWLAIDGTDQTLLDCLKTSGATP